MFSGSDAVPDWVCEPSQNVLVSVHRARRRQTDGLRCPTGDDKLSPAFAAHRDERRDHAPGGEADPRKGRLIRLASFNLFCGLFHVRSTWVWLVGRANIVLLDAMKIAARVAGTGREELKNSSQPFVFIAIRWREQLKIWGIATRPSSAACQHMVQPNHRLRGPVGNPSARRICAITSATRAAAPLFLNHAFTSSLFGAVDGSAGS